MTAVRPGRTAAVSRSRNCTSSSHRTLGTRTDRPRKLLQEAGPRRVCVHRRRLLHLHLRASHNLRRHCRSCFDGRPSSPPVPAVRPTASRPTGLPYGRRTARNGELAAVASAKKCCAVRQADPPLERLVADLPQGDWRPRNVLGEALLEGLVEDANAVIYAEARMLPAQEVPGEVMVQEFVVHQELDYPMAE